MDSKPTLHAQHRVQQPALRAMSPTGSPTHLQQHAPRLVHVGQWVLLQVGAAVGGERAKRSCKCRTECLYSEKSLRAEASGRKRNRLVKGR